MIVMLDTHTHTVTIASGFFTQSQSQLAVAQEVIHRPLNAEAQV